MRTQCWRRGVGKSWSSSSSSRSLQKVSGIFEVRFLPWHGTISFFLHVCECHVLPVRQCSPGFGPECYSLSSRCVHLSRNDGKRIIYYMLILNLTGFKCHCNRAGLNPGVVFGVQVLIYVVLNHKCCVSFYI